MGNYYFWIWRSVAIMQMMKKIFYPGLLIVLMAIIFGTLTNVAFAWPKPEQNACSITDFAYLEDASGEYSFEDISSPALANQFKPYPHNVLSLGITKSIYWIRFQLPPNEMSTATSTQLLQFKNPNIDKLDVFIPMTDHNLKALRRLGCRCYCGRRILF